MHLEQDYAVIYARRDQGLGLASTLQNALAALSQGQAEEWNIGLAGWRGWESQAGKPLIAILDQVEEHFTRPNPQLPDELPAFLAALRAVFGDPAQRPKGKLVLSFRKEWLAEIDKRLAEQRLPFGKVFLERLDRQGVMEAIAGPARAERLRQHYGLAVAPELPGLIADDLLADPGSPVAPTLQILLTKMWHLAKESDYDRPVFDQALYRELKRQGLLLEDFLAQQLETLRTGQPAAVDSGLALDLLALHTTSLGTAEERTVAELRSQYAHRPDTLDSLLQQCQELYLLVDPAPNRPGKPPASRLAHDTLAPLVRRRFEESDAPGQRARRILESRAVDWEEGKQGTPLDDADLKVVEGGLAGTRAQSGDEQRLVAASRRASDRRRQNRHVLYCLGIVAVALIATAAIVAFWQADVALQKQAEAERQAHRAKAGELAVHAQAVLANNVDPSGSLPLILAREAVLATWDPDKLVTVNADTALRTVVDDSPPWRMTLPRHGHTGLINSVVFSPDGETFLTASADNTVRLWNVATMQQVQVFMGHSGIVNSAKFSPDGTQIVTASDDQTARIWDAATGQEVRQLSGHTGTVFSAAYSLDGTQIVTASADQTARIWDAATGQEVCRLSGHTDTVVSAAYSPDGTQIVTAGCDHSDEDRLCLEGSARISDAATGQELRQLTGHTGEVNSAVYSPDGTQIVTASWDQTARIWDATTGKEVRQLTGHADDVVSAAYSADGAQIVTASDDQTVRIWDAVTGQ